MALCVVRRLLLIFAVLQIQYYGSYNLGWINLYNALPVCFAGCFVHRPTRLYGFKPMALTTQDKLTVSEHCLWLLINSDKMPIVNNHGWTVSSRCQTGFSSRPNLFCYWGPVQLSIWFARFQVRRWARHDAEILTNCQSDSPTVRSRVSTDYPLITISERQTVNVSRL